MDNTKSNWQQNAETGTNFTTTKFSHNEQNSNGSQQQQQLKTQGRAMEGVDYGIGFVSRKKIHDADGNTIDEFDPDIAFSPNVESPVRSPLASNRSMNQRTPQFSNRTPQFSNRTHDRFGSEGRPSMNLGRTYHDESQMQDQHNTEHNENLRNFIGNFENESHNSHNSNRFNPTYDEPPKMTHEEINNRKEELLAKLARLEAKGYKPVKVFTFANSLEEIETIYSKTLYQKKLDEAIKFQGKILIGVVGFIEKMNDIYNPFNLYLSGWSESVMTDLDSYDEVFEELYEKYKDQIDMGPEIKLLGMVFMSGAYFHFSKAVLEKAETNIPGISKILNNNPDLKKKVVDASANEMKADNNSFIPNMFNKFMNGDNPLMSMFKGETKKEKEPPKRVVKQRASMDYENEILNSFKKPNNKLDLSQVEDPDELSEN